MSKNVAVFVDVANVFYAAKAAGVDIDYVTLLKSASAGRDLVRAYAYTGLDPDNENQRNFHDFLRRSGYKVVSKDIRKYGDGKVKANLDIELVVDMMKTARNLDIAIVVSGDGDFAPAIRAVQEQGVRVEVISFRGNTSSDLIDVADIFTDITQLAKVEKGSSRSGRRVASDDEDLSMTEVPDKQTEGTGDGRSRGRGRGRTRDGETAAATRGRGRARPAESEPVTALTATGMPLVALPGERLARSAAPVADDEAAPAAANDDRDEASEAGEAGDEPARRRRRRGGRGRGRGRGEGFATDAARPQPVDGAPDVEDDADDADHADEAEQVAASAPRGPRPATFGSVWDTQIGVPQPGLSSGREPSSTPFDDGDFDEPEIPEYLIAERRSAQANRSGGGAGRGGRGGARAGYASAVDRERFGRGASGGVGTGGGINRYPEVRPRDGGRDRDRDRDRAPRSAPRSSGGDPWSDVPPELEAMLRAQVAKQPRKAAESSAPAQGAMDAAAPGVEDASSVESAAPKSRAPRRRAAASKDGDPTPKTRTRASAASAADGGDGAAAESVAAPKRRTTRKTAATDDAPEAAAAPKRRATRKAATTDAGDTADASPSEAPATPKRRTTRKVAATTTD